MKNESLAVDAEYVLLPCLHNVGVLLQLDLLFIGPCSAGLRHRTWRSVKDMNGLAESGTLTSYICPTCV